MFIFLISGLFLLPNTVSADGYPPYWDYSTSAIHFSPVAWPADSVWIPYNYQGVGIKDQRTQDPSNGGTSPQNYVNVSSQCTDQSLPSIAWYFDSTKNVLFFRWRVEQIPNTYATGPSPGTFGSTDPWKSAQWTVMIDIDGDGYREFAFHLNGSTGSPSKPIDVVTSIYSNTSSQSIDYIGDPSIYELFHNPTAFVDQTSGRILNFRNMFNPSIDWPNGSGETVWDYGTTRSTNISTPTCTEYYIDYQIPLAMLDASSKGGPTVTSSTPISLSFATANSLQNPLQKDAVFDGIFTATPEGCLPFGDTMTLGGGYIPQPVVDWVKAEGCGPATLSAQVRDTASTTCNSTTVTGVDFYRCYDKNGNNSCDTGAGESWVLIAAGSKSATSSTLWTLSWNSSSLAKGQYLIGVKATDSQGNITWSYLAQADVGASPPNYANPTPTPGIVYKPFINSCGRDATITKSVAPSSTTAGSPVVFTITITNNTGAALTVNSIFDILPSGFSYVSTDAGSTLPIPPAIDRPSPEPGATGTIQWTWSSGASIPSSADRTLVFTANVSGVTGTYSNVSSANITDVLFGVRTITSNPVDIGVGAPRLTIAKEASKYSVEPNDPITYTITYSNDSPINTTSVVITDVMPAGLNFISANKGGTYNSGTRTITWNIGNLSSLEGPYTVSFNATIDKTATTKTTNTATISSNETAPASASASVYVKIPLNIDKSANKPLVYPDQAAPNNQVIYTISYQNTGSSSLSNATITDPTPPGFSYVSLTNDALFSGTAVEITGDGYGDDDLICESGERCIITWTASGPLAAGGSGSVTLTLQANYPYSGDNFIVNTATMAATGVPTVFDTAQTGVVETGGVCYSNYFHDETVNVGYDSPPDRQISDTVAPLPSDTGAYVTAWAPAGATYLEFMRFYNPISTIDQPFSDAITTRLYVDRVNGFGVYIRGEIFDYDPVTGTKTSLGFQNQLFNGNLKGLYEFTITPTGGTLLTGHRLLWVFYARSAHPSNPVQLQMQYDGTVANLLSGTTPDTFAISHARLCSSRPELVITKDVDRKTATPGQTLVYTINFANLGVNNATGAQIADILPSGTSFVSATLNGSAATPVGGTCPANVCTFNVRSSDTATSGQITGKNSGVLIINALISASPPNSLTNKATLSSNETAPVSDAVTTNIGLSGVPNISVLKSASKTRLIPGDTVTYTLLVVNTGSGTAIATTVTDVMPTDTYYTYVGGSITGEGANASGAPTLSWTLTSMAPGASRTLTYQMLVGGTVPAGVTTKSNTASATEGGRNYTSNTVIVSITANPILSIIKSVSTPPPFSHNVGTGNGVTTVFDSTLLNTPVQLNTIKILVGSTEVGDDSGTGYIIGNNLKNSTINYTTGALHLEFITAPTGAITAKYNTPASPGDTLEYTIAVTNVGDTSAQNVFVTDPIPSYTSYKNGTLVYESSSKTDAIDGDEAYFDPANNRTVFNIGATLAKNVTRTMKFSVVVNSVMPNGTTILSNIATVSATNAASKNATAVFNVKTAPVLTLSKSAPATVPYPVTTVTLGGVLVTNITVASVQYISVGDVISVLGIVSTVTAINGNILTLDTPVTAGPGTQVLPTIKFVLSYVNSGKADATNVIVRDTLQTGLTFLTASEVIGTDGKNYRCIQRHTAAAADRPVTGASWATYWVEGGTNGVAWVSGTIYYPSKSSFACTNSGQVVNCNVGTLPSGGSGSFIIRARPVTGTYTNTGLILSTELTPISSNTTPTQVGALELSKSTSTAAVVNSSIGTTATYTINIRNEFNLIGLGVSITDALPAGFTYASTTSVSGGACNPAFYPNPPSRVLGTDGSTYTCIAAHTADATNRPVTGANWRYYWVQKGGAGGVWTSGTAYIAESQPTWSSCTVNANAGFGAVAPFALTFTVNVAPTVGAGTYQNPVTATSTNMSVLPFDELNTTAEDVTVSLPADLKVAKTVTLTSGCGIQAGCAITYNITVTNVGTATATAFTVNDVLPASVTYTGVPPYTATEGTWNGTNWIAVPGVSITATSSVVTGTDGKAYTCIKRHVAAVQPPDAIYWVLGGSNPVAWVGGTTYSSATAKLTIPATINSVAGTITNTALITASTFSGGGADTNTSNNTSSVSIVPTSISLSSFGAYEDNGNVLVEWETSSEVNTIGFFLSRLDKSSGRYTQLNSRLLPSVLTPPIGGSYSLIDKGAVPGRTYTYLLTEAEANGTINTYGPFIVTVNKSRQSRSSLSVTSSLSTASGITGKTGTDLFTGYTRKAHEISEKKKVRLNILRELRRSVRTQKAKLSGLMIKIPVEKDGLYFFEASRISELLGISYDLVKYLISTNNLALSSQGNEVAYLSAEDSSGIFFYGLHTDSIYTKENIYWLYHGNGTTMQYTNDEGPAPVRQTTFTETVHAEEDKLIGTYPFIDPNSDFWFWDQIYSGYSAYDTKSFTVRTDGAADTTSNFKLTVNLQGITDTTADPDHHALVSVNGTEVGEYNWNGTLDPSPQFEFSQQLLNNGDNTVEVKGLLDTGAPWSLFYIDSFDLTYQKLYEAKDNSLVLKAEDHPTITVYGFTVPDMLVFDITDPNKPSVNTSPAIDSDGNGYSVSFVPSSDSIYLATTADASMIVADAWADTPSNLVNRRNIADYIIIAPDELTEGAKYLADYRKGKGLQPMVVNVEDIMDEFNYGLSSPKAIKSFLRYAYYNWEKAPKYVLLVGDSTYDYRDNLNYGENLVPTMVVSTPMGLFTSDNILADVNSDHVPEIAIGRLPVLSSEELRDVTDKIIAFERNADNRIIMLADNADSGGDFPTDSDALTTIIPSTYKIRKIYLSEYSIADAKLMLFDKINTGTSIINYFGHAGATSLAAENLLDINDVASLSNINRPFIMNAMTCMVGQYAFPGGDTLSETLILKKDGGAVAVWAPSGLAFHFDSKALDEFFFTTALMKRERILGNSILKSCRSFYNSSGPTYLLDIYNLQGDPALKLW